MSEYNKILQHKLELNQLGDMDFKNQEMMNNFSKKASIYENKLAKDSNIFNTNNNNINSSTTNETAYIPAQFTKSSSSKPAHKTPKSIFRKHSNSSSVKNEEDQDKEQLIIDTSFESTTTSKVKPTSSSNSKKQHSSKSKKDNHEFSDQEETNDQTLKWSSAKKSMSETEKIPLVSAKKSHQKKKSNISEKITMEPLGAKSSKTSTSTNQLSNLNKMSSATENEGFNQTFESNI